MMKISLLLPTRHRTHQLTRFLDSVARCAQHLHMVEVILYIDEDDLETQQYNFAHPSMKIVRIVGPRTSMGVCNSECYRVSTGDIIMLVNDDVEIRHFGWDTQIREAAAQFPDQIYLLYPNDLFKKNKLPVFPILSRVACEALCHPFPQEYRGGYIDTHLLDVFMRLKCRGYDRIKYLPEVVFEHLHYRLKKSKVDATYSERNRFGDDEAFFRLHALRKAQADRLVGVMDKKNPGAGEACLPLSTAAVLPFVGLKKFGYLRKHYIQESDLPVFFRMRQAIYFFARFCYQRAHVKLKSMHR